MFRLLFLHLQRIALGATIDGYMKMLEYPLSNECRTRVSMAHASAELEALFVTAEIRRIRRGLGLRALEV